MQPSKYNITTLKDGKLSIFNTLTQSFVNITPSAFEDALKQDSELSQKLLDMGIFVSHENEDLHKFQYLYASKMFGQNLLFLYICPTTSCNFRCSYCFEGTQKKKAYMDDEVEKAVVEYIVANKDKEVNIVWFGGEPLMGLTRIASIDRQLKEHSVKYTSSMITNGSLLTKRNVELLNKLPLDFIQISMDGTEKVQDKRRFFHSGKGSFSIIMQGIDRLLSTTSIRITIQVAVDKENIHSYEDLLLYMNTHYPKEMDDKRILMNYNIVGDRTNFDNDNVCFSHSDRMEYIKQIKDLKVKNNVNVGLPGISQPCMYRSANSFAIDAEGYLYKCLEFVGKPTMSVGNLLKHNMSLSKLAECSFSCSAFENEECRNCKVFPICGGGCPTDRLNEMGKNQHSCSFYKEFVSDYLSIIQ